MGCGCNKKIKPSLFTQAGTAWKAAISLVSWKSKLVSKEEYNKRLGTCNACEYLKQDVMRCTECGCFVKFKALYKSNDFECPKGKWL